MPATYERFSKPVAASNRAADVFLCKGDKHPGICELTDLLADLRHWSDCYAVDFFEALESSYARYLEDKQSS